MRFERTDRSAARTTFLAFFVSLLAMACGAEATGTEQSPPPPNGLAKATFAGGCFWCMEEPFDKLPGVVSVVPGYTDGTMVAPTYQQVVSGGTGHTEAVEIVFDPKVVSYEKLLHIFWRNIDPLVANRQFCDIGEQYRTGIYTHSADQRQAAETSMTAVAKQLGATVRTQVRDASPFWVAEEYHRRYYEKNPVRYSFYRRGCGRDARLEKIWGEEAGGH